MWNIAAGSAEVKTGLYEYEGLIALLVAFAGKNGDEWKVTREKALAVIFNITFAGAEVKKGLHEHEGLITLLVAVIGNEEEEWKEARENVLWAIQNISVGSEERKKGKGLSKMVNDKIT